jgi:hypothetical protein
VPGANPMTVSYKASAVKNYNATNSRVLPILSKNKSAYNKDHPLKVLQILIINFLFAFLPSSSAPFFLIIPFLSTTFLIRIGISLHLAMASDFLVARQFSCPEQLCFFVTDQTPHRVPQ